MIKIPEVLFVYRYYKLLIMILSPYYQYSGFDYVLSCTGKVEQLFSKLCVYIQLRVYSTLYFRKCCVCGGLLIISGYIFKYFTNSSTTVTYPDIKF